MPGKITRVSITCTLDTSEGPQHRFYGLAAMSRHPPEKVQQLLDGLQEICDQIQATRDAGRTWDRRPENSGPPATAGRVPFEPDTR